MNKSELITSIAEKSKLTKKDAEAASKRYYRKYRRNIRKR